MQYRHVVEATFLARPNRFIAHVALNGQTEVCHVKNTGRCKELLVPGATVYLEQADNPARKTKYSLIAVQKGDRLINMDSQAPNRAVQEWLAAGGLWNFSLIKPEATYKTSRFDFYCEGAQGGCFIEVKGCTLEENGVALFPDAPTQRGVKHVTELAEAVGEGYGAYVLLVVQMKGVRYFTPNVKTHPAFAEALQRAQQAGVQILAYDCRITPDSMVLDAAVPVRL